MLSIPKNSNISLDKTPLRYDRVYGWGADTFYFRCDEGHIGKYDLSVSTFQGFEGTVKERLTCYHRGCHFSDFIFLQNWLYQP
jgi:hypothetical protein